MVGPVIDVRRAAKRSRGRRYKAIIVDGPLLRVRQDLFGGFELVEGDVGRLSLRLGGVGGAGLVGVPFQGQLAVGGGGLGGGGGVVEKEDGVGRWSECENVGRVGRHFGCWFGRE